jgi:lipoyl(octanoyl) transferase
VTLAATTTLEVIDAGVMEYRAAWDMQLALHEQVLQGAKPGGVLMFVEHPPVITIGRRPNAASHLHVPTELLAQRGVQVVETDRGGDITFHGPGQVVAYPIIPLNSYGLNLHAYIRMMESVVIATLHTFAIPTERLEGCTGVWVKEPAAAGGLSKICAMGIKLRRWITLHGLALNVTTDLSYFDLINPCGLGRPVTSMQKLLGPACPGADKVKTSLADHFRKSLESSRIRT